MRWKSQKKHFFLILLIIGGIIGIVSLLLIINYSSPENSLREEQKKPKKDTPKQNPPTNEEENNCPYLNEYAMTVSRQVPKEFIIKLWKKGYHWSDIGKFWDWKLEEKNIPDRNVGKRIGVIKSLGVIESTNNSNSFSTSGNCSDLVVILEKTPGGGPKINIDGCIMEIADGNETKRSSGTRNYIKKLINLFFKAGEYWPRTIRNINFPSAGGRKYWQGIRN